MSKFLAPIHYWVYEKILVEEAMVESLLELNIKHSWVPKLREIINSEYGLIADEELDIIIDKDNIHTWLQGEIDRVEIRMARTLFEILNGNEDRFDIIRDDIYKLAKKRSVVNLNLESGYKLIMDTLIDGMPCDRIIILVDKNDDRIVWERKLDIHKKYYDEFEFSVNYYHRLRDEYISGLLSNSMLEYEVKDGVFEIRRI